MKAPSRQRLFKDPRRKVRKHFLSYDLSYHTIKHVDPLTPLCACRDKIASRVTERPAHSGLRAATSRRLN
jgi:hypothetical protein